MGKPFHVHLRAILFAIIFILLPAGLSIPASAQSGGSTLFGDFKVEKADNSKPLTFYVILYAPNRVIVGKQTVTNNGRYRFLNVQNGEYYIAVEVENQEITRIPILISEVRASDVRQDINLEWRNNSPGSAAPGGVLAIEYHRSAANQSKFDKAMSASHGKKNDEAIGLLKEVVNEDGKDFVAWTELGTLQFKQDKNSDAEQSYTHALEGKPDFILALLNLGKLKMAQKNYDGAIDVLTRAVAATPPSAEANHLLGECYLQIKKGSKAVGYLNEAIKLDPIGKAEVHLRLATLYNAAGAKDRAALEYEKFLEKKPDYPEKKKLQQYIQENKKP
jgi:tetratricopeptide (TPR) repeat protein